MARSAERKPLKRTRDSSSSPYSPSTQSPKRPKRRGRPPKRFKPAPATEKYYPVKSILSEDPDAEKYLIEWEGLDPNTGEPYDPTWEPYAYCTKLLVDEWERKRRQDGRLHPNADIDEERRSGRGSPLRTANGSQEPTRSVRNDNSSRSSSPSLLDPPDIVTFGSPKVVPSPLTASQLAEYEHFSSHELDLLHTAGSSQLNGSEKDIGYQNQAEDAIRSTCDTQIPFDSWGSPPKARRFSNTAIVSDSQSLGVPSDHIPSTQPSLGDSGNSQRTATAGPQLDCPFAAAESAHSVAHCLLNSSVVIPETQPLASATQQSNNCTSSGEQAASAIDPLPIQEDIQDSVGRASNTEEHQDAHGGVLVVGRSSTTDKRYEQSAPRSPRGLDLVSASEVSVNLLEEQEYREAATPAAVEQTQSDSVNTKDSQPYLGQVLTRESNYAAERSTVTKNRSELVECRFQRSPTPWNTARLHISREAAQSYAGSPCRAVSQKPEATPRPNQSAIDHSQSSEVETRFSAFEPEVDLNESRPSLTFPAARQLPVAFPSISPSPPRSNSQGRSDSRDNTASPHHPGPSTTRSKSPRAEHSRSEASHDSPFRFSCILKQFQRQRDTAKNTADESTPISKEPLGQAQSLTGSLDSEPQSLVDDPIGFERSRQSAWSDFNSRQSPEHRSPIDVSEPASAIMSPSPSVASEQQENDIAGPHESVKTQSESILQHDPIADTDMMDVEGEEPTRDNGHEDEDLEPLMATPITAEREYLVGLSMEGVQGNQYRSTMNYSSKTIVAFTESDSQEAEVVTKDADDLLTDMRNILTHVDLHFQSADALTQHSDSEAEAAEWSKNAAAKFRFLGHLFERLRWEELHIVLVSKPGETQRIVEIFVKGSNFQYSSDHGSDDDTRFNPQPDWPHSKLFISILNSHSNHIASDYADLMISLDPSIGLDTGSPIWVLRDELAREHGMQLPLITPIITNSLEHIERCISPAITGIRRMQLLVRFMAELRNRAGRVDEGSMVDRAAEAVASALTATEVSDDTEDEDRFDSVPTVGSVVDLVNSKGGSISPISISSAVHQSTSETPGSSKRQLEDGDVEPAKRMKTDEPKPNSNSKSQALREDLAYTKHRLEEFVKALEACQATNEDQKDVILGLRQELLDNKAEVAKASERIERQTEIISKLKEDKVTLEESLAEARTALETSAIPEIAQQERVRRERDEALKSLEKSKRAHENQSREMDFIREQYQTASSSAAESSAEKNSLTQQVRDLQRVVASEMERARKLSLSSANNAWRDEVDRLQAQIRDRDEMIKRQSDEIKNMRPRQGVGTRAGSVPRSPRIIGGGPGSRGGSPAPSGLGGRVERLRNLNA